MVIPTCQGGIWLTETLAAIRSQQYDGPLEIVAVDSGSTDNTLATLQQFGARIVLLDRQQFTHGRARNRGVEQAAGDIVVFLSQDAQPLGDHWLRTLIAPLADPTLGATFARQIARPDATPLETFLQLTLYPAQSKRCQWPPGAFATTTPTLADLFFSNVCSASRRSICQAFPFDERLIMSEDQAFARDLLRAGYATLYNATAQVSHSHHYPLTGLFRRHFDSASSLIGLTAEPLRLTARQGIAYTAREMRWLIGNRHWRWLLAVPIYELTRAAGRIMGARADQLPLRWRQTFSLQPDYWQRLSDQPAAADRKRHSR